MKYAPVPHGVLVLVDEWGQTQIVGGEIVHEAEPGHEPTGLLDAQGVPLWRARSPIGFDLSGRLKTKGL